MEISFVGKSKLSLSLGEKINSSFSLSLGEKIKTLAKWSEIYLCNIWVHFTPKSEVFLSFNKIWRTHSQEFYFANSKSAEKFRTWRSQCLKTFWSKKFSFAQVSGFHRERLQLFYSFLRIWGTSHDFCWGKTFQKTCASRNFFHVGLFQDRRLGNTM